MNDWFDRFPAWLLQAMSSITAFAIAYLAGMVLKRVVRHASLPSPPGREAAGMM